LNTLLLLVAAAVARLFPHCSLVITMVVAVVVDTELEHCLRWPLETTQSPLVAVVE